ncbi:transmembrane anchor protein [Cupriavidus metallidurans]|jgi:hypothetical protein|uniref:transmembrane anchor protein n=1 Tax=Cupriavidus metallidurans TaxID=119219 RepID=UPI0016484722|nr:transmembrane anchor protein [Cupriavidus metallidurans]
MYNTDLPARAELPSAQRLLRSTVLALLTAALLLVTVVLPAEYAVDPTGIGRLLGLTRMGEIKQTLTVEAAQEAGQAAAPVSAEAVQPQAAAVQTATAGKAAPEGDARSDEMQVTLKPGAATEIKLDMRKGAKVSYSWRTRGGPVNVDAHGDPINAPQGFYHGYGKDKQIQGKEGVIEAAFDGKHGWYWRNRSGADVTITLKTSGDFQAIKRVL